MSTPMDTTTYRETHLQLGRYTMRVDKIENNQRQFNSQKGLRFKHNIYFANDNLQTFYRGELITAAPGQNDFEVGGTYCFEVTSYDRHEITKCDSRQETAPSGIGPYLHDARNDDDAFSPNVSGKSYTFAMGMAKDIMVARIRGGFITGEGDDFMKELKEKAWEIHQWLLDPKPTPPPF